eukprot:TRINITY_DN6533_c1_g1_i1.p1 TRINITY_DN6533_c1_g1~~TRINITY_DN6533_c1_g1_i1.p1  ORF type:complete len:314 (+),score=53.65 TRINITY_DN6533_c1_g1_i1:47-988(+)
MEIFVQLDGSDPSSYTLQERTTGKDIKADYCKKEGFALGSLELQFEGNELTDYTILQEVGIHGGDVLKVTISKKAHAWREVDRHNLRQSVNLEGVAKYVKSNDPAKVALLLATGEVVGLKMESATKTEMLKTAIQNRAYEILGSLAKHSALEGNVWAACDAVSKNDKEMVESLLELGIDPNGVPYSPGHSLLGYAVLSDCLETAEILIAHGASVNRRDGYGFSPLSLASIHGRVAVMKILLSSGADPNIPDLKGRLPLHAACKKGHFDIVQSLIEHGSSTTHCSLLGETPLAVASGRGFCDIVRILEQNAGEE